MSVEILNMDCMKYMAGLPDNAFDLAIVDPPYKDDISGLKVGFNKAQDRNDFDYSDFKQPKKEYFEELFRISKNQIMWGFNYYLELLPNTDYVIVWNKYQKAHFNECEIAWSSLKKSRVFERNFEKDMKNKIHPTQKPIALYNWLLKNYAEPGQKIIDTHLGSASSAIAAHYFKCDFVGIEKNKGYYQAAQERFKKETRQISMF